MAIQVRERIQAEKKTAALAACEVSKAFRPTRVVAGGGMTVRAVDGVSLSVLRGEIYGLLGANGSGKSTLIRLFSTLLTPDAGTVSIFGLDIGRDELEVKRLINRVSVEASFFKKLSAMENLVYAGRLYGVGPEESRPKVIAILRRLGLGWLPRALKMWPLLGAPVGFALDRAALRALGFTALDVLDGAQE